MPTKDSLNNGNELIGTVKVRGSTHQLWRLTDKKPHSIGLENGEDGTLWIKAVGTTKSKDKWYPWTDKLSKRNSWKIVVEEGNTVTVKEKRSYTHSFVTASIWIDNVCVYETEGTSFDDCYAEARHKKTMLQELDEKIDIKHMARKNGRKIYYKGLPSKIISTFIDGSMMIRPDVNTKDDEDIWWRRMIEPWYNKDMIESVRSSQSNGYLVIDLLDDNIYWSRNDRMDKIKWITAHNA